MTFLGRGAALATAIARRHTGDSDRVSGRLPGHSDATLVALFGQAKTRLLNNFTELSEVSFFVCTHSLSPVVLSHHGNLPAITHPYHHLVPCRVSLLQNANQVVRRRPNYLEVPDLEHTTRFKNCQQNPKTIWSRSVCPESTHGPS